MVRWFGLGVVARDRRELRRGGLGKGVFCGLHLRKSHFGSVSVIA